MLLELRDVSIQFGGLKVIDRVSFTVKAGELIGLIGPNGAGKTTAFNLISGIYKPTQGEILFEGHPTRGLKAHEVARRGVVRTFQNIRLFSNLAVIDNILLPMHARAEYGLLSALTTNPHFREIEHKHRHEAMDLLKILSLESWAEEPAGTLPYGVQRKIEIARALAGRPKLLLLDEPAAGMNPSETKELMVWIEQIRRRFNIAVLLIEHDMKLVMGVCERLVVLDHGVVIAQGQPKDIQSNPKVIEAYLGVEDHSA